MQGQLDGITLTQQGQRYALGRSNEFYGVWRLTPTRVALVEQFPLDQDSWHRARRRFEELERLPGRSAYSLHLQRGANRTVTSSGIIIGVGVLLGIVGLFPGYLTSVSITSQGDELLPHIFYLAGWTVAGVALFSGERIARIGALFGLGLSVMTFGFYLSDLGSSLTAVGGSPGSGLYLTMIGWLACAGGTLGAIYGLKRLHLLDRTGLRFSLLLGVGSALAIGTAATFAPSWDRFTLFATTTGQTQTVTEGYAFANPGIIIAADIIVMVLVVILVALALSWRSRIAGAALLTGALVPHVAQIFSAVIQSATPPLSTAFGISAAQAAQVQLQITSRFTVWFYLYCLCVALLTTLAIMLARRGRFER